MFSRSWSWSTYKWSNSLADFSKKLRDMRDLSKLEEEVEAMKAVVEDINKDIKGVA